MTMNINQVGILIEAFGSGGMHEIQIALCLVNSCREEDSPLEGLGVPTQEEEGHQPYA